MRAYMRRCWREIASVKIEEKIEFKSFGTGSPWLKLVENLTVIFFYDLLLFYYFSTWIQFCNDDTATKNVFASFLTGNLWLTCGCLQGPPSRTCWTQSMALRWTIGCKSRRLCWGNVCLCDWTVPWADVNWAACNHSQAHMISVCSSGKRGWDYPFVGMFHFETVIEIDFCLLLPHPDWHLNISDSPKCVLN